LERSGHSCISVDDATYSIDFVDNGNARPAQMVAGSDMEFPKAHRFAERDCRQAQVPGRVWNHCEQQPVCRKRSTPMAEKNEKRPKLNRPSRREKAEPKPPAKPAPNPPPRDCADAPAPNPRAA